LLHGRAPQGTGKGDATDNDAAHRAAEAADEACTNSLGGLGGWDGGVGRDRHGAHYRHSNMICQAFFF